MKKIAIIGLLLMLGAIFLMPGSAAEKWATCDDPKETYTVTADGPTSFDTDKIENVPEETCVKIVFKNDSSAKHDLDIDDKDGNVFVDTAVISSSEETSVSFITPTKGEFKFFCSVPTHREAGMEGDFVVGGSVDAPGFGFIITLVGLLGFAAIIPRLRS